MTKDYRLEIFTDYSSGKKEYVARYVDFDFVFGIGETIDEAVKEAEEILKQHLDSCKENNIPIPSPSISPSTNTTLGQSLSYSMSASKE